MKKLFTLLMLAMANFAAHAQLSFVCNGEEIPSGTVYTDSKVDPELAEEGIVLFIPKLYLKSEENANVQIIASSTDSFQFCFGGTCAVSTYFDKPGSVKAGISENLMIEAGGMTVTGIHTYTVNLTAFIVGKEAESKISMTLVMTNDKAVLGIDNIEAGKIMVADGMLGYSFASAKPRTVNIISVSGAQVASYRISDATGSLPLTGLTPGVYAYTVDGENARGKFVVK